MADELPVQIQLAIGAGGVVLSPEEQRPHGLASGYADNSPGLEAIVAEGVQLAVHFLQEDHLEGHEIPAVAIRLVGRSDFDVALHLVDRFGRRAGIDRLARTREEIHLRPGHVELEVGGRSRRGKHVRGVESIDLHGTGGEIHHRGDGQDLAQAHLAVEGEPFQDLPAFRVFQSLGRGAHAALAHRVHALHRVQRFHQAALQVGFLGAVQQLVERRPDEPGLAGDGAELLHVLAGAAEGRVVLQPLTVQTGLATNEMLTLKIEEGQVIQGAPDLQNALLRSHDRKNFEVRKGGVRKAGIASACQRDNGGDSPLSCCMTVCCAQIAHKCAGLHPMAVYGVNESFQGAICPFFRFLREFSLA